MTAVNLAGWVQLSSCCLWRKLGQKKKHVVFLQQQYF